MTGAPPDPVRAQPPTGRRLSRRVVVGGACGLAAIVWLVLLWSHPPQQGRPLPAQEPIQQGRPLRAVLNGATRYQDLPPTPPPEKIVIPAPPPQVVQLPPPPQAPPAPPPAPAPRTPPKPVDPYERLWGGQPPQRFTGAVEKNIRQASPLVAAADQADMPGHAAPLEPATDANSQFLQRAAQQRATRISSRVEPAPSPYTISAGWWLPAVLLAGINSDLPEELVAMVRQPVFDSATGQHLLIPQGTRLLGMYNHELLYGQERVLVAWTHLIFPNGSSLHLEGMPGVDLRGMAGLTGRVNHHSWKLFKAVLLSSVLSVGSRVGAGSVSYDRGIRPEQDFLQEFGQGANQAGQAVVRRQLQIQPTVEIQPGAAFNVLVARDMVLSPYSSPVAQR